ncbi:MAG: glycosyltransferase family 4 protein [Polaromonas sp.]|nr:glycosyltransferase family 4 protein [Polaromonas sp.]
MKILLIHQNFPGQFRHLTRALMQDKTNEFVTVGREGCPGMAGLSTFSYKIPERDVSQTHPYVLPLQSGVIAGQAVFRLASRLRQDGFVPDVVLAHPGWGETLYIREVFPEAALVHFCEYYYQPTGQDAGFDPEFPVKADDRARIITKNALQLLVLEQCDLGITSTAWQRDLFPERYRSKITVAHEGIDTASLAPRPGASFTLPNGRILRPGDPVVTYVARNLEPYRGFHAFMRALPAILAANPDCQVVIAGGDAVSYGLLPKDSSNWREHMLKEVQINMSRVHFVGVIPRARYIDLLHVSAAHVHLSYPFVLSWSLLEAMAAGCLVIASGTAPVREVMTDGRNGVLVDFFDSAELASRVSEALTRPARFSGLRQQAAEDIRAGFDVADGVKAYRELLVQALDHRSPTVPSPPAGPNSRR